MSKRWFEAAGAITSVEELLQALRGMDTPESVIEAAMDLLQEARDHGFDAGYEEARDHGFDTGYEEGRDIRAEHGRIAPSTNRQ